MMNMPGKIILMVEKSIRYGNKKIPLFIGCEDINKNIHSLKQIIFDESVNIGTCHDPIFLHENVCQDLINDLYRAGFRPSDEIKKDDLILTLQKEIDKRDKMINDLMERFVFKGMVDTPGRKILP